MLLFRLLEVDCIAPSGALVNLLTDLPAPYGVREVLTVPASPYRAVTKLALRGTDKGKLYSVAVRSPGAVKLYGIRAYVRRIGRGASDWQWISLPVTPTSDGFIEFRLPITPTSDQYLEMRLPIAPTSDSYVEIPLPIEPSPQTEQYAALPVDV